MLFDHVPLRADTLTDVLRRIHHSRTLSVAAIRLALDEEARSEEAHLDREFEEQWDASHGVRRGLSFTTEGVLQYQNSEIEEYKVRLAAASTKVRKSEFEAGFRQGELNVQSTG